MIWNYYKLAKIIIYLSAALGGITVISATVAIIFKGAINNFISAWINRAFLSRNTTIVQSIQSDFSKTLSAYKSDLDQKLIDYKRHTDEELARLVEPLKASLNRDNIAFQISRSEQIKRRFLYIEELFGLLFAMNRFMFRSYAWNKEISIEDSQKRETELDERYFLLVEKYQASSFFLNDDICQSVETYFERVFMLVDAYQDMREEHESFKNSQLSLMSREERIDAIQTKRSARTQYSNKRKELGDQYLVVRDEIKRLVSITN